MLAAMGVQLWADMDNNASPRNVRTPTWSHVETAIHHMDGGNKDAIRLDRNPDGDDYVMLMIEGGLDGAFVVVWFRPIAGDGMEPEQHIAMRAARTRKGAASKAAADDIVVDDAPVTIAAKRARTRRYPARWCVDIDTVLACAKEFFETGTRSSALRWEHLDVG